MIRVYSMPKRTVRIVTDGDRIAVMDIPPFTSKRAVKELAVGTLKHNGVDWDHTDGLADFEIHKLNGLDYRNRRFFWVEEGETYTMPLSIIGGSRKAWSNVEAPCSGLFVAVSGEGFIIPKTELVEAIAGRS